MHHSSWLRALAAFLAILSGVGHSQAREREPLASSTCAEQIQRPQMRRLSTPQIMSRLVGNNTVTVPDYAGRGSQVTLEVVVGPDGAVLCIDNPRGHGLMVGPAIKAASGWRFKPLRDGDTKEPRPFYGDVNVKVERGADAGGAGGPGF
jgi:hypothetical protein